ncbi:glycosyltransferase family 4 protein [Cohnella algarum]|uniref:glycosyltransferase family 4 protein n=1 Tax=Cohnella algarum TaxID=2044859 RepID=UPI0019674FFA|nr:glycosyltransferase family 4 protein [Cohnella algarum]MBN2980657.1 glycosyltransferase family 4 protein [Cohnella algarum]
MKKKVLLLGNHGFVIYNFRKELIRKLLSDGYEVYISLPKDEKVQTMIEWGCHFVETNVDRRGTNPIKDLKLILHYLRVLKKIKPDVVLTYTIKPNLYGGIACRILKIPYINNITGLGSGFNKGKLLKSVLSTLYKVSLRRSSCVFFQNTEDRSIILNKKIISDNHRLIPGSGVNLNEYEYKDFPADKNLKFIFIGRIMKDKGIDQYLEAARRIKEKYNNVEFNIIGFIEKTQPHYQDKIKQYEDQGIVTYLGYQSNVKPFIQEAHCLIQPSQGGEGMSNVLLEAAAMGRILIASNIPGCREVIQEGRNGFTFEPQSTEDLVKKIEQFIQIPLEVKIKMSRSSRLKVEREFDRNIVVGAYVDEINKIVL